MKKISIITPCRNAEKYIRETVESVIGQSAILSKRAEIEYIICDGNSTDQTLSIIESYRNSSIKIISEADSGMYDALVKGLRCTSGEIVAYLNAGDYYNKYAFDIVLDIFETKNSQWLTGYSINYNEKSYVTGVMLPYRYRKEFFAYGFYGTRLPFVQQESTFWSSTLNELIDYDYLSRFKYAGDFYLWLQFSKKNDLKIVEAYLGGFRIHREQLSKNMEAYIAEMQTVTAKARIYHYALAAIDKLIWYAPSKFKKFMNKEGLFRFNHELQEWI